MQRDFQFYKNDKSEWYIDLPEWKGDPDDLQMIQGADEWLDLVSDSPKVKLTISDNDFDDAQFMTLIRLGEENLGGGGNYFLERYQTQNVSLKIWLCDIVEFIFDKYPQRLYFKVK